MVGTSEEDQVSIQALKQWCALHKSDKHSDALSCTARKRRQRQLPRNGPPLSRKEVHPAGSASKQQETKRNFSNPLKNWKGFPSPTEESGDETDDTLVDLHVLAIQPEELSDSDVFMEDDESLLTNQNLDPFGSNIQTNVFMIVC